LTGQSARFVLCPICGGANTVAKKKGDRIVIKLKSTESEYIYYSEKNKRNDTARLEINKYDPLLRKHVLFREAR
jgi:large subunit ribosomal protein L33